ncbi:N-acetylneuraminate synthase [Ferrovibrio terrae]|uniref:N-acetylneuraminate synthase n=1 Tax=Ferrovibrio terrae TaxID=2594003 RepID=A0A516GY99_9PROT|nr:N-acetylneuraminate synthase family protein [Ferrovibrio terrae]QDO96310.1 N-acetylneuraminate synthase [Ferrovibrio terrae]
MTAKRFHIDKREIGGGRAFLIAEVAQAHDGSLGAAHAFIDAASDVGADAIKFQTHIAAAESTLDEPFRLKFSRQDVTRYDYWRRMEFTPEQWRGLAQHARDRKLVFLSSAFSVEAVDLLEGLGVPAWKIGSGEIVTNDLLERMSGTGKPMLISTGMSGYEEITAVHERWSSRGNAIALFQCTTKYPTAMPDVGLNVLARMKSAFPCPIGLSDHSGRPEPAMAAIARGADLVELHVTFDHRSFGPDTVASVTFADFARIVTFRDCLVEMDANPVDKDALAAQMRPTREIFGKSLALKADQPAGTVLRRDMLTLKKPGTGIAPDAIDKIVGCRLLTDADSRYLLRWNQIEAHADEPGASA